VRELESLIAVAIVRSGGGPTLRSEHIPEEVGAELQDIADNVALRNQRFRAQLAEIAAAFDAASLPYAVLKGGAYLVLPVYPTPSMRVMGDLDLLVAEERLDEACDVLRLAIEARPDTSVVCVGHGCAQPESQHNVRDFQTNSDCHAKCNRSFCRRLDKHTSLRRHPANHVAFRGPLRPPHARPSCSRRGTRSRCPARG